MQDPSLGDVVGRVTLSTGHSIYAGHRDDRALSGRDHPGKRRAGAKHCPGKIDRQRGIPIGQIHLRDGTLPRYAGAARQPIDPAIARQHLGETGLDLGFAADIKHQRHIAVRQSTNFDQISRNNYRASLTRGFNGCGTYARRCAGDENYLISQIDHKILSGSLEIMSAVNFCAARVSIHCTSSRRRLNFQRPSWWA